jgi:hypothetical protein
MGGKQAGAGMLQQGQGFISGMSGQWEPTILYMIAAVVIEMVGFAILGKMLR